jgi:uncharacterized membrane protein
MKNLTTFVSNRVVCGIALFLLAALTYFCKKTFHLPVLYYPLLVIIAATITCFAVIVIRQPLLSRLARAVSASQRLSLYCLAAAALLYLAIFTVLSISRHDAFATRMYDFGNMDQAIWNASQGRGLENTSQLFPYENRTRLANHVEGAYFFLALLYRFVPSPSLLLFFQTACIAAGMLFFSLIAGHLFRSRWKALAAALVYALYPTVQHMNLFEFHADVLAVPALLAAYLAFVKKRPALFWVCIAGALLCKEYAGLAAGGMGLGLLLYHKNVRTSLPLMAVGFGYFLAAIFVVNPFFNKGQESVILGILYSDLGGQAGVGGIARYMLSHPAGFAGKLFSHANAEGLFYLLFPLAFLPAAVPLIAVAVLPVILKDLFIGVDVGIHRLACALPMLFVSFVFGMKKIETLCGNHAAWPAPRTVWIFTMAASLLGTWAYGPSPLGHRFWSEQYKYVKSPRVDMYKEFLSRVPDGAAVSASDCFAPHLTHRRYCYVFPQPFSPLSEAALRVGTVLIDTMARDVPRCNCDPIALVKEQGFELVMERQGVFLFTRRNPAP